MQAEKEIEFHGEEGFSPEKNPKKPAGTERKPTGNSPTKKQDKDKIRRGK